VDCKFQNNKALELSKTNWWLAGATGCILDLPLIFFLFKLGVEFGQKYNTAFSNSN
jgi:hypothetical protein